MRNDFNTFFSATCVSATSLKASDSRGLVYAVLSMAPNRVNPDYKEPIEDMYLETHAHLTKRNLVTTLFGHMLVGFTCRESHLCRHSFFTYSIFKGKWITRFESKRLYNLYTNSSCQSYVSSQPSSPSLNGQQVSMYLRCIYLHEYLRP